MSLITNFKINGSDMGNMFSRRTPETFQTLSNGLPTNTNYVTNAISETGQYMIIGVNGGPNAGIYISSNNGVSWSKFNSGTSFNCVSCSSSGQYMLASEANSPNLYYSTNYGSSFSITTYLQNNITSLTINSNGMILVSTNANNNIGPEQYLYYTTIGFNFLWYFQNSNFQGQNSENLCITSCKMAEVSSDTSYPQFMCCTTQSINSSYTGGIWIYTTSLPIWTNYAPDTTKLYQQIAISYDGTYGWVTTNDEITSIYNSSNYGKSWSLSSSPQINTSALISISSSGSTIFMSYNIDSSNIGFVVSYNYGSKWNNLNVTPYIPLALSLSSNGVNCLLTCYSDNINETGVYLYTLTSIRSNITGYTFNGKDISLLFHPQTSDPGTNYIKTNYQVTNFTPLWSNISGNYDFGQIFQNFV